MGRRSRTVAPAVLLVAALVLVWQWRSLAYYEVLGPTERWSSEATYFFTDRSDPVWEYQYVVRGNEVIVQKAVFPGYKDRTWYRRTVGADHLMNEIKDWAVRPGNTAPPFLPHGPHHCRISLTPDETKERGEAWFENGTADVNGWFATLRHEFVKVEYKIEKLPDWVSAYLFSGLKRLYSTFFQGILSNRAPPAHISEE